MATTIKAMNNNLAQPAQQYQPLVSMYRYDRLNRLREARNELWDDTNLNGVIEINPAVSNPWNSSYQYDFNGNIESLTRLDQAGNPWDNISYTYPMDQQTSPKKVSNRLQEVNNAITGTDNYPDQNEFEYDDLGNLSAESDGSLSMEWTNSGKLKKVTKPGVYEISFTYDAMGNRVTKHFYDIATDETYLTYYVRDAQGNNMATYFSRDENNPNTSDYVLRELYLYGSNRLGYITLELAIQNLWIEIHS
jgi:hypothetical protein